MKNTIWNDFGIPAVRIGLTSINIAEAAKHFAGGYGGYDPQQESGGYDPRQESGFITARSQLLPHQWSKKAAPAAFFETARSSGITIAAAGTTRGRVRPAARVRVSYSEVTVSTSSMVEKSRPSGFFRDSAEQRDYDCGGGDDPRAGTTRGRSQGLLRRGHSFYLISGRKKPPQRLFSRLRGAAGLQRLQHQRLHARPHPLLCSGPARGCTIDTRMQNRVTPK